MSEGHVDTGHADQAPSPRPAGHAFGLPGLFLFGLLIIGSFVFSAYFLRTLVATNQLAAVVTATLVDLTNGDRRAADIGTLTVSPVLVAAAQAKADDMAKNSYFAHTSPDGRNSWTWFRDAGYVFSYAGENLAVNFSDSDDVEKAWMKSPTHRANILNGKFTEIGIATAVGEYQGKKTTFVVQMFGTPARAAAPRAPVAVTEPESPEEIAIATTEPEGIPAEGEPIVIVEEPGEAPVVTDTPAEGAVEAEAVPGLFASAPAPRYASLFDFFASSPEVLLRTIYIVCALVIVGLLALATELELKRHHLRHVAAALFLMALMGSLFFAADQLVFTPPVIGEGSALPFSG